MSKFYILSYLIPNFISSMNNMQNMDLDEEVVLYEVKKILKSKVHNGEKFYLIKWKNWPDEYNSWESEKTLLPIKKLINIFDE